MDVIEKLNERRQRIAAEARAMKIDGWDTVTVGDLKAGDVILSISGVEFPFPFTLAEVKHFTKHGHTLLKATHGWFNMKPIGDGQPCVRAKVG